MKRAGVIGVGNMGSGLAKNLIASGFPTVGRDIDPARVAAFEALGGRVAGSAREVGEHADAVFVMVMNAEQARSVILGDGLVSSLAPGAVVILSATVHPHEARELAAGLEGTGIDFIDTPVSGGFPGAQSGTLTLMSACPKALLDAHRDVLEAVSERIFHVGEAPGMGQTVKACLQALMGSVFTATFEAAVLAAKAGVDGQVMYDVFASSSAGCPAVSNALEKILDRAFVGTGSHISTMYKDLTISMDLARAEGVPLFTAAAAMQLFQSGKTRYPEGDNWIITRILEEIAGTEVSR